MSLEKSARSATLVVRGDRGLKLEQPTFSLQDAQGKKIQFDAPNVRIGAGPGNDLCLDDPTVSSVHLEIAPTERGFRVRDLGSTNGTYIEGVRISEAFIEHGQTLRVGGLDRRFEVGRDKISFPMSESTELHGAVGTSTSMRTIFSRVERVAKTDATVLIQGETGTGKEVIAWSLYEASRRNDKPFVVVDCGAIARNLIESELFGHEKGAFTGAHTRRLGAFERAHEGTLFLDEIGELELELQPKLLRALERREIQRVGGEKTLQVNVRILAATHRDLRAMVARGEFREDLYYRLAVVPLELPPLRERRDDIQPLVQRFLDDLGVTVDELPPGAMQRFLDHSWPGNCRELKNAVERAVVLGETRFLGSPAQEAAQEHAGVQAAGASMGAGAGFGQFEVDLERPYKEQKSDVVADFEERYARMLIKEFGGNVSAAARKAGIDRMSLHKILDRYGLDPKRLEA